MEKALIKTGATVRAQVMMQKAVVQTVIMYGRNSSLVTEAMMKVLEGFNHQVPRRISGMSSLQVRG